MIGLITRSSLFGNDIPAALAALSAAPVAFSAAAAASCFKRIRSFAFSSLLLAIAWRRTRSDARRRRVSSGELRSAIAMQHGALGADRTAGERTESF